ncbi:MAG: hypothetical protein ABMA64_10370 [Myxococcota bacterium]
MGRSSSFVGLVFVALLPASCDLVNDVVNDDLLVCADVCTQVDSCEGVTPPSPSFGAMGAVSSGEGGVDCAVNCAAEDRAMRGYADCQMDCIVQSKCGELQECWNPRSELYASYCLNGRDVPEVGPGPSDPPPGNGSQSGSTEVDEILDDPAVAIAVDESDDGDGFVVNYGDEPPQLVGKFKVHGTIDEAKNARPVGSPIDTEICFWDYTDGPGGVSVSYCEEGVPGKDHAPLTGTNDAFTAYFVYDGQATVMFSGSMNDDGTLSDVEALVVYTYATDVWERSHTDWQPMGTCDSCN